MQEGFWLGLSCCEVCINSRAPGLWRQIAVGRPCGTCFLSALRRSNIVFLRPKGKSVPLQARGAQRVAGS